MMQLKLEHARAGMVLVEDVISTQGQLLLRAGAALSGNHLRLLHANGIQEIVIGDGTAGPDDPAADGGAIEARFRHSDRQHPVIQALRRIAHQRANRPLPEAESDDS